MDPCWVFNVWRFFLIGLLIFVFFGFLGKGIVFGKEHDLPAIDVVRMSTFWSFDGQFWLWGTVALLVSYFVLIFIKLFFVGMWAGARHTCCPRKKQKNSYVAMEEAARMNLPVKIQREGE